MCGRGNCQKYQSRDEKFPEPNGEGNLVSRLVFFANTPLKHDVVLAMTMPIYWSGLKISTLTTIWHTHC